MSRHAYMIMAHHDFEQLYRLLQFLDSECTDIYLHIDRRAAGADLARLRAACSRVFVR